MKWPFPNLLSRRRRRGNHFEGILELFDDHVHIGELLPDGRFLTRFSGPAFARFVGAEPGDVAESSEVWNSCVEPLDRASYDRFWGEVVLGRGAEVTYRLRGLDGVTRTVWHRARARALPDGRLLIQGLVSDVTKHEETIARLADADHRFMHLLDVVGEHVYRAIAHPDGRIEELFQGPGADRLLGGADPDGAMENWTAAIHPDDLPAIATFDAALCEGRDADVQYRLRGYDGVTRWVHDRAIARRGEDGTVQVSGIVSDVTERRRLHSELASAHSALARVVEAMEDHLYTLGPDLDGRYRSVYRGPNLERLTGSPILDHDETDAIWASMVHPHDRGGRDAAMTDLARGEPIELEYRVTGRDGVERIVLDRLRPRLEADGTLLYDGMTRDITDRRNLENELRRAHRAAEQLAITDELTGAYNRRHFTAIAGRALAASPSTFGLLLLDADHFKRINDVHGHLAGDAVLVELVRRLRTVLGPEDVLARWGGEEFAVLLRIDSDDDLARRAAELLDVVAATPVEVRDLRLELTVSIGGIHAGDSLATLDALIEHADHQLYAAKRDGRNRASLPHDAQPPFTTRIA
ncbi:diguanylate cyclase [Solirubrobacter ginsenosidimutans]|uniref:Diguanylate cyclase n=1 Tax=Solirubrobacter ginsenosidimutans TaxID=490573 RepID=A0A9X3MVZ2_9ACTN|nr:diguanylate cyclase [Solirubrobacter ginsenosidimutans]MDA0162292.1 diguanylate cyclase [Solirubrobacter ginsenosidimutans]